jgi:hypothetical protein
MPRRRAVGSVGEGAVTEANPRQQDLLSVGETIRNVPPKLNEIDYQHTVLTSVTLPVRDPGEAQVWEHHVGNDHILIEAGRTYDPEAERYVPAGLPYGPRARLILLYLQTHAKRTQSPVVETGRSLNRFLTNLGLGTGGSVTGPFREQLRRLAVAKLSLARTTDTKSAMQVTQNFVSAFQVWKDGEDASRQQWSQYVKLSDEFFQSVIRHSVPLDDRAIRNLKNNAHALDLYSWLASRLHDVRDLEGEFVTWRSLHIQFGHGVASERKFRQQFEKTRKLVAEYYDGAGYLRPTDGGLILPHGVRPPVPSKTLL